MWKYEKTRNLELFSWSDISISINKHKIVVAPIIQSV